MISYLIFKVWSLYLMELRTMNKVTFVKTELSGTNLSTKGLTTL
jgi:hypothetical protein